MKQSFSTGYLLYIICRRPAYNLFRRAGNKLRVSSIADWYKTGKKTRNRREILDNSTIYLKKFELMYVSWQHIFHIMN